MSQQINLYQAKFRKLRLPLSARDAGLSLLLIAVSAVAYTAFLWNQNDTLQVQATAVEQKVAAQQGVADQLNNASKARKKDLQLEAAAQRAEQQLLAMREVVQLIEGGAIGDTEGYSEKMRGLARQTVSGVWLTGFTFAGNAEENQIRGRALDAELVPAFLRRLNSEKSFQGQRFATLLISTPEPMAKKDTGGEAGKDAANVAAKDPTRDGAPPALPNPPRFLDFSVAAADVKALGAKYPGAKP